MGFPCFPVLHYVLESNNCWFYTELDSIVWHIFSISNKVSGFYSWLETLHRAKTCTLGSQALTRSEAWANEWMACTLPHACWPLGQTPAQPTTLIRSNINEQLMNKWITATMWDRIIQNVSIRGPGQSPQQPEAHHVVFKDATRKTEVYRENPTQCNYTIKGKIKASFSGSVAACGPFFFLGNMSALCHIWLSLTWPCATHIKRSEVNTWRIFCIPTRASSSSAQLYAEGVFNWSVSQPAVFVCSLFKNVMDFVMVKDPVAKRKRIKIQKSVSHSAVPMCLSEERVLSLYITGPEGNLMTCCAALNRGCFFFYLSNNVLPDGDLWRPKKQFKLNTLSPTVSASPPLRTGNPADTIRDWCRGPVILSCLDTPQRYHQNVVWFFLPFFFSGLPLGNTIIFSPAVTHSSHINTPIHMCFAC